MSETVNQGATLKRKEKGGERILTTKDAKVTKGANMSRAKAQMTPREKTTRLILDGQ